MIQQQDQTDPINFEVHMYHPTAMANAVTPTSWFYTLYVHTPSSIVQRGNQLNFGYKYWLYYYIGNCIPPR